MRPDRLARSLPIIAVAASAVMIGCHEPSRSPWPSTSINAADSANSRQLISGFYDIEGTETHWRWAGPVFTVALRPPGSPQLMRPAKLSVQLYFPPNEIDQLGPITLRAIADDEELGATTFSEAGPHEFVATVPASSLCTNVLPITFSLDKFLPRSAADSRDLGAVITSVSLRSE